MPYLPRIRRSSLQSLLLGLCLLGCAAEATVVQRSIPEPWGEVELEAAIQASTRNEDLSYRVELRRRLLDLRPDSAALQIELGRDLLKLGHPQIAGTLFQSAASCSEHGVFATMELAHLQELDGRMLVAAALLEQKAATVALQDRRMLLERASRLRQDGGDMEGALEDLEAALIGIDVSVGEQRLLEQVQAFQRGDFAHTDDAIKVFRSHPNQGLRIKAGRFLAANEFPNSAAVFADMLGDRNPAILQLAITELASRGESMDCPALLPLLDHPDAKIRRAATVALGKLNGQEAIPLLLERLDPQDRALFRAQNLALERLCGQTFGLEMDANLEQRQEIVTTWVDWWNERG